MIRRPFLLVAVVLAACTTDLPTEPDRYAGPALGTPLPPPSAPPEPLETMIEGGGPNILKVLGFYESPTLARVTVSGVLTYSGLNAGYYPGQTGTIDYQGRQIPGQCAMNLAVYIQGGGLIGGTYSCPAFWQSIGSQSTLSVVSGQVMVGRNAAAPGACFYGGTPCATITGAQTVTVTPIDGEVKITLDQTATYPGGIIAAKFTADPEWFENKQMPFTLRQVTFEGSGPILGGGTTTGCTSWPKPNECSFRLYQSGCLVAAAIVSGKLRTTRHWLVVQGGDSVPPQPPDSTPTDTISTDTIPTDTLPGGGECGVDATSGLATSECEPPPVPVAVATCLPTNPTRGQPVTCSVRLEDGGPFILTGASALSEGHELVGQLPQEPVSLFTWSGDAVAPTDLTFELDVTLPGGSQHLVAPAHFGVIARSWDPFLLPNVSPLPYRNRLDPGGRMTLQPRQGMDFLLGVFRAARLRMDDLQTTPVTSGPNAGFILVAHPVTIPRPDVYTHPGLKAGPWYDDQDGGKAGSAKRCTQSVLPALEARVEIHEGLTRASESHWGLAQDLLELSRLQPRFEALYHFGSDPRDLKLSAQRLYDGVWNSIVGAQDAFDDDDYPRIFGSLGCVLDMDPLPADG